MQALHNNNMLLKVAPAFSLLNPHKELLNPLFSSVSFSNFHLNSSLRAKNGTGLIVCASNSAINSPLTGVIFEPFEEVKKELDLVPSVPQVSLARQKYNELCEAAINEQIKFFSNFLFLIHLCSNMFYFLFQYFCVYPESLVILCYSVEYNVSYVYHAMFAYFDRDNVALKGLAK